MIVYVLEQRIPFTGHAEVVGVYTRLDLARIEARRHGTGRGWLFDEVVAWQPWPGRDEEILYLHAVHPMGHYVVTPMPLIAK